jgi:predicted ribosome quality control (RQC) complex YloA/Tae2 family protein
MVLETLTQDNTFIYIGQSDKENDELRRAACQNYGWFHLQDTPSPHVVVAQPLSQTLPENIRLAALLCKRYSKKVFREARSVKVIYTEIKNVKNDPKKHGSCSLAKSPKVITVYEANDEEQNILDNVKKSNILKL